MFTPKFFYDIAAAEAPVETAAPPIDLAGIMAKSGRLTQPGNEGEIPKVNTTEKKEEVQPASASAPATANQTQPADKGKTESPKPTTAQEAAKPQTEAAPTAPTWQEVLKQQQPNAVLKELGYGDDMVNFLAENKQLDPKMLGFIQHWQKTGDAGPYLKALSTDYGKMAPEDVMRHQLQLQNPELDAKQLDTLYKVKVVQRYKLNPDLHSEEEVDEGRIELMADVKSIRQALTAEQQNFLIPKPTEAKPAGPDPQEQRQQEIAVYRQTIESDPYSKSVLTNNKLILGDGDDQIEVPVNSAALSDIMFDSEVWAKKLTRADGKPDTLKNWLIAGVAEEGMGFIDKIALKYKALGGKSAIAPIENAKPPGAGTPAQSETESKDPAAAMAKRGRISRGGE